MKMLCLLGFVITLTSLIAIRLVAQPGEAGLLERILSGVKWGVIGYLALVGYDLSGLIGAWSCLIGAGGAMASIVLWDRLTGTDWKSELFSFHTSHSTFYPEDDPNWETYARSLRPPDPPR